MSPPDERGGSPAAAPQTKSVEETPEASAALAGLEQRIEAELTPLLRETPKAQPVERIIARVMSVVREEFYNGPLPHPAHFDSFEKTCPGSADRILKMAEDEQKHRHGWERRALNFEFVYSIAGLAFGFFVGLGLVIAAVVAALYGHDIVAGGFVAASAIGMVTAFIKGRNIFGKSTDAETASPPKHEGKGKKKRR